MLNAETVVNPLHFVTFENEGWCVQNPDAFLDKGLLA